MTRTKARLDTPRVRGWTGSLLPKGIAKGGGLKPHGAQGHCWHGNGRHGPGSRYCCICRPDLNGPKGGGRGHIDGPCCEQAKWTPEDAWSCQIHDGGGGRESGAETDTADRGGAQSSGRPANGPGYAAANPAASGTTREGLFPPMLKGDDSGGRTAGRAANPVAANPARTPVYWHRQILGDWHGDRASCVLCHLIEELRVFKAELAALRKEAVKGSWRFRAEKSEARVKELRKLLNIRYGAEMEGWSVEDRAEWIREVAAELRGEDRAKSPPEAPEER